MRLRHARPTNGSRSLQSGVTLIELMVAMAVIAIALLALMSAIFANATLQQLSREQVLAQNAARAKIEEMRSQTYSQIYALYNSNPYDDPGGYGTSPYKNTFTVTGLNAIPGTPVGQIVFPEVPGLGLYEGYVDASMGMPRDLNGNGVIDITSVSSNYRILPVKIVIRWQSTGQNKSRYELNELITSE